MRKLISKINSVLEGFKEDIKELLEKLLERNGLSLLLDDVLRSLDVEYEILSLNNSTSIRSDEEETLLELLQRVKQIAEKALKKAVSGALMELGVSLKIKTVLAEESDTDLIRLIDRMAGRLRGAGILPTGRRVVGDLIIDREDGVYLTIEIDAYVPQADVYL